MHALPTRICEDERALMLLVGIGFKSPSKNIKVTALIDTGSEITILKANLVHALGLKPLLDQNGKIKTHTITNAAGCSTEKPAYLVQVRTFDDRHIIADNIEVTEQPFPDEPFCCLIGTDILRRGKLIYDGLNNTLSLSFNSD